MVQDRLPLISVVVVNYNRRDLLRSCLHSIFGQTEYRREVIVIDNGSSDGSVELVRGEFPSVRLIANADNRGFCGGNNQGIQAAKGEFVALLNNDAEAEPRWLAELLRVFADPTVGMAASKILVYEDPGRIDKAGHVIFLDGQNRGRGTGERDVGQYESEEEVLWPDGCAAMYRRRLLEEIGGFDEDFFAYADDADLGLRARIAGWTCRYVPGAVVRHHRSQTLGVHSVRRLQLIERNRVLLAAKLFPGSLLWLNVPLYAARLGAGLWAAARGKGEAGQWPGWRGKLRLAWALFSADLMALRLLPKMWRKRAEVNRYRRLSPRAVRQLLQRHQISLKTLSEQAN